MGSRPTAWLERPFSVVAVLVVAAASMPVMGGSPIYVNWSATGANDGSSWADAFVDLQNAIAVANDSPDCPCEIWVAAGTYKPDRGGGDRFARFEITRGVSIYGGFGGWEECADERDPGQFATVLSGDLFDDDDPNAVATSSCCQIPISLGCDNEACETIVVNEHPQCATLWFGTCSYLSAIMCGELCRPTRSDNTRTLMTVWYVREPVILDGLTFTGGEGICSYEEPQCLTETGGLSIIQASDVAVRQCTFTNNAGFSSGPFFAHADHVLFESCLFTENGVVPMQGGTSSVLSDDYKIRDCTFRANRSTSLIVGGVGEVERCTFRDNSVGFGLAVHEGAAYVRDCWFVNNSSLGASASRHVYLSSTQLVNCRYLGNYSLNSAGAITNTGHLAIINSVINGNSSGSAETTGKGAVWNDGNLVVIGSDVTNNSATTVAGIQNSTFGSAYIIDSVLWGNVSATAGVEWAQLDPNEDLPMTLRYNSIQGWTGNYGGVGNTAIEPGFVDPDGPDDILGTVDDDLRLSSESLLINAGDPDPPLAPYLDADGYARKICNRIDIGAYEFGIGDHNCDRVFELADFAGWPVCVTGPAGSPYPPGCSAFDFYTEVAEDVDLHDFARLQNEIPSTWP